MSSTPIPSTSLNTGKLVVTEAKQPDPKPIDLQSAGSAATTDPAVQQRQPSERDTSAIGPGATASEPSAAAKAKASRHAEAAIRKYDTNGDGIDANEIDQWVKDLGGNAEVSAKFSNTDKDGVLTQGELQNAYERQYAGEEAIAAKAEATKADAARQTGAEQAAEKAIAAQDKDGDGKLNDAEVKAWASANKFDANAAAKAWNKDGDLTISKAELTQAYKAQADRQAGVAPATPSTPTSGTPAANTTPAAGSGTPSTPAAGSGTPSTPAAGSGTPTTPAAGSGTPATPAAGSGTPSTPAAGSGTPTTPAAGSGTPATPVAGAAQTPAQVQADAARQHQADMDTLDMMEKFDGNRDAQLDAGEMAKMGETHQFNAAETFRSLNADGNLRVSSQELNQGIKQALDADAQAAQPPRPADPAASGGGTQQPTEAAQAQAQAALAALQQQALAEAAKAELAQAEATKAEAALAEVAQAEAAQAEAAKAEKIQQQRDRDALMTNCLDEMENSGGLPNARALAAVLVAQNRPELFTPEVAGAMSQESLKAFMGKASPELLHSLPAATRAAIRDELDGTFGTSASNQPFVDRLANSLRIHP